MLRMELRKGRRNIMNIVANVLSFLSISTASFSTQSSIFMFIDEPTCPEELL
jgi:cyclic lactone autoinducer peptide